MFQTSPPEDQKSWPNETNTSFVDGIMRVSRLYEILHSFFCLQFQELGGVCCKSYVALLLVCLR